MADVAILGTAAKAAAGLVAPMYRAAKAEWDRRDATSKPLSLTSLDEEMNEALDVLAQNPDNAALAIWNAIKGGLSGRPKIFEHPPVKAWLKASAARRAIRDAVYDWVLDTSSAPKSAAALAHFEPGEGEDATAGHVAFEYTIAFIVVSMSRRLGVGDKLQLIKLDQIGDMVRDQPAVPQHLIDDLVKGEVERLRRTRFLIGEPIIEEAQRLTGRLTVGDFKGASPTVRGAGIAQCVRWMSQTADVAEMGRLLAASTELSASPEAVLASAFVEGRRSGFADGLKKLQPIDTPAKRLVALQLRVRAAIDNDPLGWFASAGFSAADLDADGKYFVLAQMVAQGSWAPAFDLVRGLNSDDFVSCPALYGTAGIVRLSSTVTDDLKHLIAGGSFQIDAAGFPLDDTPTGLADRRLASSLLGEARSAAESVGNLKAAIYLRNMKLWLDLRDPATSATARKQLDEILGAADHDISVVPMALGFGIEVDIPSVEKVLGRLVALDPDGDEDIAFTRFAIVQARPSPSEALDDFNLHRKLFYANLNVVGMTNFEVQLLVSAGQSERAREVLASAAKDLPPAILTALEKLIANGPGRQSIASLEAEYEDTKSVLTLGRLVETLSREGYSEQLIKLWRRLVQELKSLDQAEQLIRFLSRHNRLGEIDLVLTEIDDLVPQSADLRASKAWSDYRAGRFAEAQLRLSELQSERSDANDRALLVNLIVASGRWPELLSFVDTEWAARDDRDTRELLGTAQLAARVRSPRLVDLLTTAVAKSPDDPHALITAYSIATEAGLDEVAASQSWLEGAMRTSGDDGPLQSISLEELVEQAPDWNAQTDDVWTKFKAGLIPMSMAGPALRRPMLELQLAQMIANRQEDDPRRRGVVPAFSGKRESAVAAGNTLGLDLTALITLGSLDLLTPVLAQGEAHISHGTLATLFEQRAKSGFHQPSQIKAAHSLRQMLATGRLTPFAMGITADPKLISEVGPALAGMLTEAGTAPEGQHRYVVRSSPVTRIGSFRNDPVDLSAHQTVLCSCQAVIDKLSEAGRLTNDEERHARAYLERQETRWDGEPSIADGAELYLDDLSVAYLKTVGVLEKLAGAGLKAFVSRHEVDEANALIAMEGRTEAIEVVIERIRATLAEGIASATVKIVPMVPREDRATTPVYEVLDLAAKVDSIVCDDRFFNQHKIVETPERASTILTSLDVIDALVMAGTVSDAERLSHRTTLRQSGLALFPVSVDELAAHVRNAPVREGRLIETGDLRAFRENLSLTLMRGWFSPRSEDPWLVGWADVLIKTVVAQWNSETSDTDAAARSKWLLERADPRSWSALIDNPDSVMAAQGHAWQIIKLTLSLYEAPSHADHKRFTAWLESEVQSLKIEDPSAYDWMLQTLRNMMQKFVEKDGHLESE